MKKLLEIILLSLLLIGNVYADDIRDFEIEGVSIGNSLLDYYSKKEIDNFKKASYYKDSGFTTFDNIKLPNQETFEFLTFSIKTNDKKYIIVHIGGDIDYLDNIKDCYSKKDEIVKEMSELFNNSEKKDLGTFSHNYDKTGDSKVSMFGFYLKTGLANVSCYDWSKKLNAQGFPDSLRVVMLTRKFNKWLEMKAYK